MVNPDHGGERFLRQPFFLEVIMQSRHSEIMRDTHCQVKMMNAQHAFARDMRAVHNFGMSIKSIRDSRDLSQADLAEMAGMAQSTVHRAEALAQGTRLSVYLKIAEALDVPLYDLFADERAAAEEAILTAFRSADEAGKSMLMALAQQASSLAAASPEASSEVGKE